MGIDVIAIIICIATSIISGSIMFFFTRYLNRREKHEEAVENRRARKDYLMIKSVKAIGELTVVTAIAVRDGKSNGEMTKALSNFDDVDKELDGFLIQSTVKK